jgi:hypothetical protein
VGERSRGRNGLFDAGGLRRQRRVSCLLRSYVHMQYNIFVLVVKCNLVSGLSAWRWWVDCGKSRRKRGKKRRDKDPPFQNQTGKSGACTASGEFRGERLKSSSDAIPELEWPPANLHKSEGSMFGTGSPAAELRQRKMKMADWDLVRQRGLWP